MATEMAEREVRDFPAFPFKPYPIQLQFMSAVYAALDKGGVAIVESPTGTGKTLSLICSALQWLQDRKTHEEPDLGEVDMKDALRMPNASGGESEKEPNWMRDFSKATKTSPKKQKNGSLAHQFNQKRPGKFILTDDVNQQGGNAKDAIIKAKCAEACEDAAKMAETEEDDDIYLIEEYESGDECLRSHKKMKRDSFASSSSEEGTETEEGEDDKRVKVYYCSRTHSQLSQFVKELRKTPFSTSLKSVPLGSRKSLCLNKEVLKLGNSSRINERCLELQNNSKTQKNQSKQGKTKRRKNAGCPFLKKVKLQRVFKREAHELGALDLEDMLQLGSTLGTCPYYGSRSMVPLSDLVVLPYQSLLHSSTRQSLGVKLKNSIVVIDEAHNLVDSLMNMHSCLVTVSQLRQVSSLLTEYFERFRNRLGAGNRRYIQTILLLIRSFLKRLSFGLGEDAEPAKTEMMTINDFLFSVDADNINMFKLWQYITESHIVHKVSGYGEKIASEQVHLSTGTQTSFHATAAFILSLMNSDEDGRVLVVPNSLNKEDSEGKGEAYMKFVMLNASRAFGEVLEEAHAIVLAGGTLQPIAELRNWLFPNLDEERIHVFSCGHIVPKESVLPLAISHGPSGKTFDFTYQFRSSPTMMDELGRLLCNLSSIVPQGIVVFLPSFEYESQVFTYWTASGILPKLEARKRVFREPRNTGAVESILQEYQETIEESVDSKRFVRNGALILCVVGGKLSEGINFSDGMGRCVVMVGLPYPSPSNPELIERMKYLDKISMPEPQLNRNQLANMHGSQFLEVCGKKGKEYYENICMKAVNQSIGRAIRHAGDYAAILLVDERYTLPASLSRGPSAKLPGWIRERFAVMKGNFGEVHKALCLFFKHNKMQSSNQN